MEYWLIVRSAELRLVLSGEDNLVRLDLMQSSIDPRQYNWRLWRIESFRLHPSFPADESGTPEHETDDELLADWSWAVPVSECTADTVDEAFAVALDGVADLMQRSSAKHD